MDYHSGNTKLGGSSVGHGFWCEGCLFPIITPIYIYIYPYYIVVVFIRIPLPPKPIYPLEFCFLLKAYCTTIRTCRRQSPEHGWGLGFRVWYTSDDHFEYLLLDFLEVKGTSFIFSLYSSRDPRGTLKTTDLHMMSSEYGS